LGVLVAFGAGIVKALLRFLHLETPEDRLVFALVDDEAAAFSGVFDSHL
jgi:hypothetical protein